LHCNSSACCLVHGPWHARERAGVRTAPPTGGVHGPGRHYSTFQRNRGVPGSILFRASCTTVPRRRVGPLHHVARTNGLALLQQQCTCTQRPCAATHACHCRHLGSMHVSKFFLLRESYMYSFFLRGENPIQLLLC
jgi:hypothetical protein